MAERARDVSPIDLDDLERQLREAAGPVRPAPVDGPLAELARIVGPASPRRAPEAANVPGPRIALPRAELGVSAGDERSADPIPADPAYAELRGPLPGGGDETAPGLASGPDSSYGEFAAEAREPADASPPLRKGRHWLLGAVALAAVTAYPIGVAYRSRGASPAGGAPVIRADSSPVKIQPPAPSADPARPTFEPPAETVAPALVLPRGEVPVDIQAAARAAPPRPNEAPPPGSGIVVPAETAPPASSVAIPVPPQPTASPFGEPRRVRTTTVTLRPDGAPVVAAAPTPAPRAIAPAPIRAEPAPVPVRTEPPAPVRTAPPPREIVAAVPKPVDAAEDDEDAPAKGSGSHVVQVSSTRSEKDAKASIARAKARFTSILGGQPSLVRKADLGTRGTYYRARFGPMARAEAEKLCGELKAKGGNCVAVPN